MPRLGAKTRNHAEVSTVFHVWPDLLEVGKAALLPTDAWSEDIAQWCSRGKAEQDWCPLLRSHSVLLPGSIIFQ
jgi:hypothetical protein